MTSCAVFSLPSCKKKCGGPISCIQAMQFAINAMCRGLNQMLYVSSPLQESFESAPQCEDELTDEAVTDESGRYWSVLEVSVMENRF